MNAASPIEREIKIPLSEPSAFPDRIRKAGFIQSVPRVFEVNMVFDTPERSIRTRGELLRLRTAGDIATLTWKGPAEMAAGHKQRVEIETTVGDPNALATVLTHLGYRAVFRYEKFRTEFRRASDLGLITVDETPVGWFAELEGDAGWIDRTAAELGFGPGDYVTLSYASLYVEHCRRLGIEPGWMTFAA